MDHLRRVVVWTIYTYKHVRLTFRGPWANLLCVTVTVVHLLNPNLILGVNTTVGFAAAHKQEIKMAKSGPKCDELGWECISLAVETYGGWGEKLINHSSKLAGVRQELSGRLSLTLLLEGKCSSHPCQIQLAL